MADIHGKLDEIDRLLDEVDAELGPDSSAAASGIDLAIVLDRSGSMGATKEATIEGFNSFITKQRAVPGACSVNFIQFDDLYETRYSGNLAGVELLTHANYLPRGNTALYDAIGRAIADADAVPCDRHLILIVTDGQENASHEHTHVSITRAIEDRKAKGWDFVFIGVSDLSVQQACSLGVVKTNTAIHTGSPIGVAKAWRTLNTNAVKYRGCSASNASELLAFTDSQAIYLADDAIGIDDEPDADADHETPPGP